MQRHTAGMTLIESLIALAVVTMLIMYGTSIVLGLSLNTSSKRALVVNQASQAYFETIMNTWRNTAQYGVMTSSTTLPKAIAGYTWKVTVCEVNMATFVCGNTNVATQPNAPVISPAASTNLMRLTVEYVPTQSGLTLRYSTEASKL